MATLQGDIREIQPENVPTIPYTVEWTDETEPEPVHGVGALFFAFTLGLLVGWVLVQIAGAWGRGIA